MNSQEFGGDSTSELILRKIKMERTIHLRPLEKISLFGFRRKSIANKERLKDSLKKFCKNEESYSNTLQYCIQIMPHDELFLNIIGDRYDFDHVLHAISDSGYTVIKDEIVRSPTENK